MISRVSLTCATFLSSFVPAVLLAAETDEKPIEAKLIRVRVVDSSGSPIESARVFRSVWTEQKDFKHNEDFHTNEAGQADVTVPDTMRILRLWVSKDGYPELFANWSASAIDSIPKEFEVAMAGRTTIGGVVVDDSGEPISGVRVEVKVKKGGEELNPGLPFRYSGDIATGGDAARTDDQGRWSVSSAPPGNDLEFSLRIRHPDYVQDQYYDGLAVKSGVTTEQLREQTAQFVMSRGAVAEGRIVDVEGQPVSKATILWSREDTWWDPEQKVAIDEGGKFKLPPLEKGTIYLAIAAENLKPQIKELKLEAELAPVEIVMQPGRTLRLQVVDEEGKPIPEVRVMIERWGRVYSGIIGAQAKLFDGTCPEYTDEKGEYVWPAAPDDAVSIRFRKKGRSGTVAEVAAADEAQVITLHKPVVISGAVLDDETSEPIDPVRMMPVTHNPQRPDDPIVQRSQIKVMENGQYSFTETSFENGRELILQFEAVGYRPIRIGPFNAASGTVAKDVRLERAAPLRGRVLGADGKPVSGATVSFTTKDTSLIVYDWTYERDGLSTRTDQDGMFEICATLHPPVIIASHETGYAEIALELDEQPGDLRLQPWSRVEGRLTRSGEPIVGERITLRPIRMLGGENPHVQDSFSAVTDGSGRFVFERVPPVPSSLSAHVSVWSETRLTSSRNVPLDLQPGKTYTVRLGGDGVVVRGRVRPKGDIASKLDMNYCLNYLLKRAPGITPPPPIARAGFDWRDGWSFDFKGSSEGLGFLSTLHHHFVKFQSDGSFTIHGVAEGDYQFAISIYEPPEGCLVDPVGLDVIEFTVSPDDVERGELDLGEIDVDVKLGPQVGDPFPSFRYTDLSSGEQKSATTWRGKYVLVDCWATWCGPCIARIPELKAAAKRLDSDRASFFGLCLDEDVERAKLFIESKQLDWPQGLLGERDNPIVRQQLGISSVPVYFVIDPEGRLVHRSFQLADAVVALEEALHSGE